MKFNQKFLKTCLGEISIYTQNESSDGTPLVFLHGLFFDHLMWLDIVQKPINRPVVLIDMPLHGKSKNIINQWNLDDCTTMLFDILAQLDLKRIIGVGHSWGSMTLLRAVAKNSERFEELYLLNLPFRAMSFQEKLKVRLLHFGLIHKAFYIKEASKFLIDQEFMQPKHLGYLKASMGSLKRRTIIKLDEIVRLNAMDSSELFSKLKKSHKIIVAEKDFVGIPPSGEIIHVKGGHTSPLELPEKILEILNL